MSDPTLTSFLEKNSFTQGNKPLQFIHETEHGPLTLWFQPLKRTRYAGEIRYREFVGCRVILSWQLEVPSRFTVIDTQALHNPVATFFNKRRKLEKLENLSHHLSAFVASRAWSERILRDADVQDAFTLLFHAEAAIRRQQSLTLDPLNLTYSYRMKSVDLDKLDRLIPPFLLVGEKILRAGEPPEKLRITPLESFFLKHPYMAAFLILGGLMFLLLVPFLLLGLLLVLSR